MPHPDEGLIHAWLDGELDAAESARVEALVSTDPAWAAAAAEARGLIAASARILGALDRVPAHVIPANVALPRRAARRWAWRAAAVLALMAGSAVVLERGAPELPAPKLPAPNPASPPVAEQIPAPAVLVSPAQRGVAPNAPTVDVKSSVLKKELDVSKQIGALRDEDVVSAVGELRAKAAGGAGAANFTGRRAAAAPAASPSPVSGARPAQSLALEKTAPQQPSCFAQREPRDSAARIIRLDANALADSIRLEKLTLRGDTLAAVNGRLTAIRVRCPEP